MTKKTIIPLEHRVKMRSDYPQLYVTKHARVGNRSSRHLYDICNAWTLNEIRANYAPYDRGSVYEFPNRPADRWIACPVCGCPHGVDHFAWASLRCNECGFSNNKCDWLDFGKMTPRDIAVFYETLNEYWSNEDAERVDNTDLNTVQMKWCALTGQSRPPWLAYE